MIKQNTEQLSLPANPSYIVYRSLVILLVLVGRVKKAEHRTTKGRTPNAKRQNTEQLSLPTKPSHIGVF